MVLGLFMYYSCKLYMYVHSYMLFKKYKDRGREMSSESFLQCCESGVQAASYPSDPFPRPVNVSDQQNTISTILSYIPSKAMFFLTFKLKKNLILKRSTAV